MIGVSLVILMAAQAPTQVDAGVSGYVETRHYGIFGVDEALTQLGDLGLVDFDELGFHPDWQYGTVNRVRPTLKLHVGDNYSLVTTAQAAASYGFYQRAIAGVGDVVTLERAYLSVTKGPVDITLGKQLLRWGNGLLVNPSDVFNQRPPDDLNAERPGVWALRVLFAVGETSNLSLAVALDEAQCCQPVVIARSDTTVDLTDMAGTVVWDARNEDLLLGFDVKTEFEIGAWAEVALTFDLAEADGSGHLDVELGIDYTFDVLSGLYVALEWIHQGDGAGDEWSISGDDPPDYFAGFVGGTRRGLAGTNYVLLMSRLMINTDWQVQVMNLLNLADPTGLAVVQATWLPAGFLEIVFGAQATYGTSGGEFTLEAPDSAFLPAEVRGARLVPVATAYVWGRFFF